MLLIRKRQYLFNLKQRLNIISAVKSLSSFFSKLENTTCQVVQEYRCCLMLRWTRKPQAHCLLCPCPVPYQSLWTRVQHCGTLNQNEVKEGSTNLWILCICHHLCMFQCLWYMEKMMHFYMSLGLPHRQHNF